MVMKDLILKLKLRENKHLYYFFLLQKSNNIESGEIYNEYVDSILTSRFAPPINFEDLLYEHENHDSKFFNRFNNEIKDPKHEI